MHFIIRKIKETELDECIMLFQQTVHSVNAKDYSEKELHAWAPLAEPKYLDNYAYWQSLLSNITYVAEVDHHLVGFGDLTDDGYLDRLYVHKDCQGMGIATAIVNALESAANECGIHEIITHASITAKPFFEKMGFVVLKEQRQTVRGEALTNFIMKKMLRPV